MIHRPSYFVKSFATVTFSSGQVLGYVKQRKWFVTKQFDFLNIDNRMLFSCISIPPHIWTFKIFINDQHVAQISKKWSGYGKELLTDTDTFSESITIGYIENFDLPMSFDQKLQSTTRIIGVAT